MTYFFVILLLTPLLPLQGQDPGFLVNSTLYAIALICLASVVGALFAPFPWAIAAGHPIWHLRTDFAREQATMIASAIAAEPAKRQAM